MKASRSQHPSLSTGMRQKLAIAKSLMNDPEIIFMDEPTNGLDVEIAIEVRNFLRKLIAEKNITHFYFKLGLFHAKSDIHPDTSFENVISEIILNQLMDRSTLDTEKKCKSALEDLKKDGIQLITSYPI